MNNNQCRQYEEITVESALYQILQLVDSFKDLNLDIGVQFLVILTSLC